jgi:hypothetical protein
MATCFAGVDEDGEDGFGWGLDGDADAARFARHGDYLLSRGLESKTGQTRPETSAGSPRHCATDGALLRCVQAIWMILQGRSDLEVERERLVDTLEEITPLKSA